MYYTNIHSDNIYNHVIIHINVRGAIQRWNVGGFPHKGAVMPSFNNYFVVHCLTWHYGDVIMDAIASQITSLTIVYSIVYSDADQR